jgi:hypothetical protein
MANNNIDIFKMTYKESASYFKHLENLEKIRHTNSPSISSLALSNEESVTSSSRSKNRKAESILSTEINEQS